MTDYSSSALQRSRLLYLSRAHLHADVHTRMSVKSQNQLIIVANGSYAGLLKSLEVEDDIISENRVGLSWSKHLVET